MSFVADFFTNLFGGGKKDSPPPPNLPPAPSPVDANAKARADLQRRRKISLLTGGATSIGANAPELSATGGKSLLGQ